MEQKTVSGKIPAELHARFRSEMEARGWTMSFALEQVINEHFENEKGRNNTMENTRTLAFAVSEEFFQLVKEYLGVLLGKRIRRLTPRECLRLQGWRDEQIDRVLAIQSDNQVYKQAGNGVTVTVVEAIGRRLAAVHNELEAMDKA